LTTLEAKQQELARQLGALRDPQARLGWLVERARARDPLPATLRADDHLVEGCLARLWFVPEYRAGHCHFRCDSESQVMKSVAVLLCEFYSDRTPAEILAHDPGFLRDLGVSQHLTPNRRNGLARVWEKIRAFAESHQNPS
jgi:cysteine desulfuration protein SufE